MDDERPLKAALVNELEDVEKTLTQPRINKAKIKQKRSLSLNVDYYFGKVLKKKVNVVSRLQKLEKGEKSCKLNLYKFTWKLESFSVVFNNAKHFEENKNKNDIDPDLTRDFYSTAHLNRSFGYKFLISTFPYGCGSTLGKSMSITVSAISGPFEHILSWPLNGKYQSSTL